jgi:hypothetical protein
VYAALKHLLYKPISISAFTNSVNTVEIGTTVTSVTLSWTVSGTPTSQTLTDVSSVTPDQRSAVIATNLTANKTWTLGVSDGTTSPTASTTVRFLSKAYWGTNASPT